MSRSNCSPSTSAPVLLEKHMSYKIKSSLTSEWRCYLFGNKPEIGGGLSYRPRKGQEPNRFVRWMMKICFDCTWVKEPK